jgi:hypothetical protein
MLSAIFSSVALKWFLRRLLEVGGIAGSLFGWYATLSPGTQGVIANLLAHNWDKVSLAALIPLVASIGGYAWSFVSSVRPHVVAEGQSKPMKSLPPSTQEAVKGSVRATKTTLAEKLASIFAR